MSSANSWKRVGYVLFLLACLCMSGCFNSNSFSPTGHMCVLSTNRMIHDCVQRIAGDILQSIVLIDGSIDPHTYEMVKGDEDKFAISQLFFCNGLGLEHSMSLRKQLEGSEKTVAIGDRLVEARVFEPLQEDGFFDAHIWADMKIWIQGVREITRALVQRFPEWETTFLANSTKLIQEMEMLDLWAERSLATIPEEKRYLVSGHNAFSYFTRRYLATPQELEDGSWVRRCISPEGVSPEAQISIRDIMKVVDYINEHDIDVIFPEDTLNQDALKKIQACAKNGHPVRLSSKPLYSDNVIGDYFNTFRHNVTTIVEELGGVVFES